MTTLVKQVVLIGGGHANVFVLRDFARKRDPGLGLTLIAKELAAPYSGMLPGYVAGHYSLDQCHIDLVRLSEQAGAQVIHGAANGIDLEKKLVRVEGHEPVPFHILSIDVGITPDLDAITGARENAIAVKPVSQFAQKWDAFQTRALTRGGPRRIAVVGGGAAGVELVLAARHGLRQQALTLGLSAQEFSFALVAGGDVLPSHNARARALVRAALKRANVTVIENDLAAEITPSGVNLASGQIIEADAVLVSTRAGAPKWLANTGLVLDPAGFVAIEPTLQAIGHKNIFAVGDCATMLQHPREKSGVFAVRQGPVVARNIRRRAAGKPALRHIPQRKFLSLVSLGEKSAIASRGSFAAKGRWAWSWKDTIDRKFMTLFDTP
jgi:selenide, water dikinase